MLETIYVQSIKQSRRITRNYKHSQSNSLIELLSITSTILLYIHLAFPSTLNWRPPKPGCLKTPLAAITALTIAKSALFQNALLVQFSQISLHLPYCQSLRLHHLDPQTECWQILAVALSSQQPSQRLQQGQTSRKHHVNTVW